MNDYEKIGFAAYRQWLAMRNHFNIENFDYKKSSVNVKESTFLKRRDKKMFSALGNRFGKELESFLISVYCRVGNGKLWVGQMLNDDHYKEFQDWQRRTAILQKVFGEDVENIKEFKDPLSLTLKDLFKSTDGRLPPIVQLEQGKHITPETAVIINELTNFTDHIYCVHPSWDDIKLRLTKYKPFVRIRDLKDYAAMLRKA